MTNDVFTQTFRNFDMSCERNSPECYPDFSQLRDQEKQLSPLNPDPTQP